MSELKWGIIGPGRIARRFAEAIPAANHSVLQAVHSSSGERAQRFADEFSGKHVYSDLEAFLNDPEVDVVYIANPHSFHAASTEAVLNAGKPVLCEKPLTVNFEVASHLCQLAEAKDLFLMEALWSRFLPVWVQVKRWLDEGRIGNVQLMNSTFGFKIPRDEQDRLLNRDLAGGVLLDMGVYNVSMSQFVMQQYPTEVIGDVLVGETQVDERTSAILKYGDVVSQFSCGFKTFMENSFVINGTEGTIRVEPYFWDTTRATLTCYDGTSETFDEPFKQNGFEYQIMEVERCLESGRLQSDIISWADTLNTQAVMDEILSTANINF